MNKAPIAICLILVSLVAAKEPWSHLPLSRQASLVEVYSPSEITVKATGIGANTAGWFKDNAAEAALRDARKAAVWFVLEGGTDPLLNTTTAKARFGVIAEEFFIDGNINTFISWEAEKIISTVMVGLPDGREGIKITKMLRVNKRRLAEALNDQGILLSNQQAAQAQGNPFIMVVPDCPGCRTSKQMERILEEGTALRLTAGIIEAYLTARQYNVQVPRAAGQLNTMGDRLAKEIKSTEDDPAYRIALEAGSDIYFVYAIRLGGGKATVQIKAHETTTARLLGAETGYSKTRLGSQDGPLVEEAVNDAMEKVLQRVSNYWAHDLSNGVQYRLIFNIVPGFEDVQKIQDAVADCLEKGFAKNRENVATAKTLDYTVWAKTETFGQARAVMRYIQNEMSGKARVTQVALNRKLIISSIEPR
jgi:hypothetical protein